MAAAEQIPAGNEGSVLFEALIRAAVDGIIVIDARGKVRVYNTACQRLFGYTAEEVVGQNVKILMPTPYQEEHDGYLDHYRTTGEKRIIGIGREVTGRRRDGSTFPMYLSVGEGTLDGRSIFVGIIHDETSQQTAERRLRDLQAELLHVSRLSAMGQMAAMLAHELNQPLTAIANYMNAARRILEKGLESSKDRLIEALERASNQALRAGQIIQRMRGFVSRGANEQVAEDLKPIIQDSVALAVPDARGIHVEVKFAKKLPDVMVDKVQIQQVLLNLLRNAAEALQEMPSRIFYRREEDRENGSGEHCRQRSRPGSGGTRGNCSSHSYRQSVMGWAWGFPSAVPLSKPIADSYGPKTARVAAQCSFSLFRKLLWTGKHTMPKAGIVHIIDDDDAVRDSLSLLLEASGYKLTTYESATVFLNTLATLPTGGCILTDVRMPGMDGLELQRTLVEKGVNLPIIVMTGHADVPIAVQALKAGAADFIEKPFSDDVLLAAIQSALESSVKIRTSQTLVSDTQKNYDSLTAREREVLEGLLVGHPNKTIAFDLGMSPRTVEVHRARVMQKMQARSLSALVRMVLAMRGQ